MMRIIIKKIFNLSIIGLFLFFSHTHSIASPMVNADAGERTISCKQIAPLCESTNLPKESAVYQTCCTQHNNSEEFIKLQNDHLKLMSKFLAATADNDTDGVVNISDRCPNTPANTAVDYKGCTLDADQDSVPDLKPQCFANPDSTRIDLNGCIPDTDGDGINDDKDKCPNSPKNTPITETGCMVDFDNDGVGDLNDQCINTIRGATIDKQGCEIDSDKDGVVNSKDFCNNKDKDKEINTNSTHTQQTPTTVNVIGCPKDEKQLLKGVRFAVTSDELLPGSLQQLDRVANTLKHHPTIKIEIAGHTDSSGKKSFNLALSHKRAIVVKKYLVNKGINADNISAVGYGESQPIADNKTEQGKLENRRVELTVLPQ